MTYSLSFFSYFTEFLLLFPLYDNTDFAYFKLTNKNKTDIEGNDASANIDELNYNLDLLQPCKNYPEVGTKVYTIGYPKSGQSTVYMNSVESNVKLDSRVVSEGIVSGYHSASAINTENGYDNYLVSNAIDSGNSGGLALAVQSENFCILGIPSWVIEGNYANQGIVQNINNLLPKK